MLMAEHMSLFPSKGLLELPRSRLKSKSSMQIYDKNIYISV